MWGHMTRMGHVMIWNIRIHGVIRLRPITRVTSENTRSRRHWGMCIHEIKLWTVVIGRHEKVLLVFVGRGVRSRLHSLCQTCEIKLVGVAFTMHFSHYVFIIIISKSPTEFVVVHVGLGLPLTPSASHFIWVHQFKLSVGPLPRDVVWVATVGEKF